MNGGNRRTKDRGGKNENRAAGKKGNLGTDGYVPGRAIEEVEKEYGVKRG